MGFINISEGADLAWFLLTILGLIFLMISIFIIGKYATNLNARIRFARRTGKNRAKAKLFPVRNKDVSAIQVKINLNDETFTYAQKGSESKTYIIDKTKLQAEDGVPYLEYDIDNPIPVTPLVSTPIEAIDYNLTEDIKQNWNTYSKEEQQKILETHAIKEIKFMPLKTVFFTAAEFATTFERIVNWAKAKYKKDNPNTSTLQVVIIILLILTVIFLIWKLGSISGDIATLQAKLDSLSSVLPKTIGGA